LIDAINKSETLRHKLFGVEFLATTTDESLITLLYHKKLGDEWTEAAKPLESILEANIIGRARKQKIILSREFIVERLNVDGREFVYNYHESGFTQPNPAVNEHMLTWAVEQAKKVSGGDLLESYCGLGNFTMPLSHHFDKVLATEVSKTSIKAAKENCELNSVENVDFVRMSSEEMVQAVEGVRPFRRMEGVDLNSYDFGTALVDPPRAGLDEATTKLVSTIPNIIYISCNPETLIRDLEVLAETHSVTSAAIFDQFPHTHHVESGVFLVREG
jgi:tRNA (uracil-5-)-methyltransferase